MRNFSKLDVPMLLEDTDIEFELESPDKKFLFIYSTRIIPKKIQNPTTFERTYWLEQVGAGDDVVDPWDPFELSKQIILATNLIQYSGYVIRGVFNGWKVTCPVCSQSMVGKIWRTIPKNCKLIKKTKGCRYEFVESDKQRIFEPNRIESI
jgi:hypothetical protein